MPVHRIDTNTHKRNFSFEHLIACNKIDFHSNNKKIENEKHAELELQRIKPSNLPDSIIRAIADELLSDMSGLSENQKNEKLINLITSLERIEIQQESEPRLHIEYLELLGLGYYLLGNYKSSIKYYSNACFHDNIANNGTDISEISIDAMNIYEKYIIALCAHGLFDKAESCAYHLQNFVFQNLCRPAYDFIDHNSLYFALKFCNNQNHPGLLEVHEKIHYKSKSYCEQNSESRTYYQHLRSHVINTINWSTMLATQNNYQKAHEVLQQVSEDLVLKVPASEYWPPEIFRVYKSNFEIINSYANAAPVLTV